MKKLKLLLAAFALLLGWSNASAYTVDDLTSAGWTRVTDLASLTLDDNYFMFVDAGTSNYSVTNARPGTDSKPTYQALQNPTADWAQVWKLSKDASNNYLIQSKVDDWYFISAANEGQGWTDKMASSSENGGFTFEVSNGKYSIKGVFSNGFVGPWNDGGAVNLNNKLHWNGLEDNYYEELACNKSDAQSPDFYIYYISRTSYDATRRSSATLETEGWSKVTATSGLGKAGYFYTFLDLSETGYETGLAMIGTNGRPQYTSVADPVSNTTQLWTTESHGVGYALKNVGVDKYFYLATAATWNTGFTSDINAAYTDFEAKVSEGKWTLSNSLKTTEFVGRWSNSPYAPGKDENIAANKAADAGKRQFYIYSIPTIAGVAEALPGNGDMTADTWYYIDIPATADNYTATATDLSKIVYSANLGTTVMPQITTNTFTAENNSLSAQRYYVKSSTDNNLVIGVSSYTYSVGSPTSSIANNAYIASLSTIDFTFSDAGTTDPAASFALLNGSAKAVLSKGGENVAEGTLSLSGKVLTATFSDVALALSSTYDIAIAAGVVGYEGEETNAAINTSFRTGIIADGVYYFKKKGEYKYLTRGGDYGTETVVDNYGISLQAMIQSDGTYYLKNVDHSLAANTNKYLNMYTDQDAYAWTIAEATGGYYLKYTNGNYMTTSYVDYTDDNGNTNRYYYKAETANEGEAIVWELLSKAEYATSLTAKKNAEITALATAAGIEGVTTLAELESVLSSDYGTTDKTSAISNPLCNSASGWTAVSYNGGSKYTAVDYHAPTIQIWNAVGGITQTVSELPAGLYKITVSATWRPGNSEDATRVGNEANTTAWIYANDNITQLKGWYEGGGTINSTQALVDNALSYLNTVYVYLNGSEDLKIGVAVPNFCQQNWCPIYNWTLTYYEAKATPAEKTALASAITAAEAKTLGFEDKEYAPYNNVAAINALAAAKAINPETASGEAVVAATSALTGATWTPNDGEKNAVYNGNFALSENDGAMVGWVTDHSAGLGGSLHARAFVLTSGGNYDKLAAFGQGDAKRSCAYFRFDGTNSAKTTKYTYGTTNGYTMPLKTGTIYKLTAQAGGWGQVDRNFQIAVVSSTDANVVAQNLKTPAKGVNDGGSVIDYEMYFVVPSAGNYKLVLTNTSGEDNAVVISNIELKSTDALEFVDGSAVPTYAPGTYPSVKITRNLTANRWATGVYPFAISTSDVDEIAVLARYNSEAGIIGFDNAASSTANVPFLMRSTTAKSEISLNNVAVAAANASNAQADDASLVGSYVNNTVVEKDAGNYILSNNTIYPVGDDVKVNAYRAYINITSSTPARSLRFVVGDITGVDNVEAATEATLKDGKYLENGKIVIVKNGQKFNANGQQVK